jgi:hypothetical protein
VHFFLQRKKEAQKKSALLFAAQKRSAKKSALLFAAQKRSAKSRSAKSTNYCFTPINWKHVGVHIYIKNIHICGGTAI